MATILGRARTTFEMDYFVSLQSCPKCGHRIDPDRLKIYGADEAWTLAGECAHCDEPVGFPFVTRGDPMKARRLYGTLGEGRSEIIAPWQFASEVVRADADVQLDPTRLQIPEWDRNNEIIYRVQTSLVELEKFVPEGAAQIPDELLSDEDQVRRREHPEWFTRAWMDKMRERYRTLTEAMLADKPRINRLAEEAEVRRPKGIDWIEREPLQQHEQWVERGKTGQGRLVVVGAEHEDMKIGRGVELSGARFFDAILLRVYLADVRLHDAELVDSCFDEGNLYGAELNGTTISGGSFNAANLETAAVLRATIRNTAFGGAVFDLSDWDGTVVEGASFRGASFIDANLDGATFRYCDFGGAELGAEDPEQPPSTNARFEECDLRDSDWSGRDVSGAVFVRCKLAGVRGAPSHLEGVVFEDADLATDEILKAWGNG